MNATAGVRLRAALLTGILAFVGISCGAPPPPAPPRPADMSGFDEEIVRLVEQQIEGLIRGPENADRWGELGMLYHAHRQLDLARQCYLQSLVLAPADVKTRFYLAQVQERLGELPEAVTALERVIELDGGYAPAHWRLGLLLLADGRPQAARAAAERAVSLDPGDPLATVALARILLQGEAPRAAADLLEAHLERRPDDRYAHFLLGRAYRRLGRGDEARDHLARGQGAEPAWSDPWTDELDTRRAGFPARLAAATELLGTDPPQAVAALEKLRDDRPDNGTVLINLGIGYRLIGRVSDSDAVLREAVRHEPARGLGHFQLAVTALAMDDRGRALEHAEQAVELQPTSAKGHALLGEILARSGRLEDAVASYRLAVRDPQDPAWLHRLGALLCQLQRWQEAVPVLQELRGRAPGDPEMLFLLGAAQANTGLLVEAAATLEEARRLSPEDPKIRRALEALRGL